MKKFASRFFGSVMAVLMTFGVFAPSIDFLSNQNNAYATSAQPDFVDELAKNTNGDGTSLVLYNAEGLGTTTLFNGTNVTARGTIGGDEMNFNIYANDSTLGNEKIVTSRQEYYLTPTSSNSYISTGIRPNSETTLEIYYSIPKDYIATSGTGHPDVAGCFASNNTNMHFGGPLVNHDGTTQFLYGAWPENSNILTAEYNSTTWKWDKDTYYHSILEVTNGTAKAYLSDGSKEYEETMSYSVTGYNFNELFLFGQNNNTLVNHFNGGIKEVKITQDGNVVRHFVAIPKGSTEFSSTAAPSNCMYDLITEKYFESSTAGDFGIAEAANDNEIDISEAISATSVDNGFSGEKLIATATDWTYIDGNGVKWAASYLEVNQKESEVIFYEYYFEFGDLKYHEHDLTSELSELLGLETLANTTTLGTKSGTETETLINNLWMDGIIGPIINYEIKLSPNTIDSDVSIGVEVTTISILDLNQQITATFNSSNNVNGVTWKATDEPIETRYFQITKTTAKEDTITAKDILFAHDKIIQEYAQEDSGEYYFEIDIDFSSTPVYKINIITGIYDHEEETVNEHNVEIKIGGIARTSTNFISGADPVIIEGIFDSVLYKFDSYNITTGTYEILTVNGRFLELKPTSDITIEYNIMPIVYTVQIVGQTTDKVEGFLEDPGCTEEVYYDVDEIQTLNMNDLYKLVEEEYLLQSMTFDDACLYNFRYFQCNDKILDENGTLSIDALTLNANSIKEDKLIIYAVYQKKYIMNVSFKFKNNPNNLNDYSLISASKTAYEAVINGVDVNGWSIDEYATAVIVLKPNIRFSILSVSGADDAEYSEGSKELLVLELNKSYNIVVTLETRAIKVDYVLRITDNNDREISGMPYYIDGGTAANFTMISYEDIQWLEINSDTLISNNCRLDGFMIYNFSDKGYEELTDGMLEANDYFFNNYVDENGNCSIYLFLTQQYIVDFYTPGFTQSGNVFTSSDLGTYTVTFEDGTAEFVDNGRYLVDVGTKIRIDTTTGKYGKFIGFAGLTEVENEDGIFFVDGYRNISVNFQSTKIASWILPTLISGLTLVMALAFMTVFLILRSRKLKREKLAREAEIKDMKRRFNISDEIAKLRNGEDVPQS